MHRKVATALVAALAIGVASCGGGDEPLTRAELARQADAVCLKLQREGQALFARAGRERVDGNDRAALADFKAEVVGLYRDMVGDLEELTPPEQLQSKYDRYLALQRERAAAFASGREDGGAETNHESARLATALGLRSCS